MSGVRTVGIVGTGLIGTSMGLALRAEGIDVVAWDPDPANLEEAAERGAITDAAPDRDSVAGPASDLLVVAAPPAATLRFVSASDRQGLTMDVAGVKGPIVAANGLPRFVGTHPMAGREVSGPRAASAALFRGAAWVVTTDSGREDDIAAVSEVVSRLGARPVRMSAAAHDEAVAAVSHVPQLLAAGLVSLAAGTDRGLDLAAGGFRDLTRVAASNPELWVEVLRTNREAVASAVATLRAKLDDLTTALQDDDELVSILGEAMTVRRGMTARAATVRVALADQPGELAKVGHALETSAVDVRDIQLRHAPHGGGGVLTLSVRPGDGEHLRHALETEGLLVIED